MTESQGHHDGQVGDDTARRPRAKRLAASARGFGYPIRGGMLVLKTPPLRRLAIAPILLTLLLGVGAIVVFMMWVDDLCGMILGSPEVWYQWVLYYLLATALVVTFLLAALIACVGLANVIAAPFNDVLSEKVEAEVTGRRSEQPFDLWRLMREGLRGAVHAMLFLTVQVVALLVGFIPLVGLPVAVAATAYLLAFEFMDYSMSRRAMSFRGKWRWLWRNRWAALGFGG